MPGTDLTARDPGIDLLRGLSIVLVVVHHTALRIPLGRGMLADWCPTWLLDGLQYNGFDSVFLFFVISGFLITSNSLRRWGTLARIDAKAFWRRRAARILPCLLLLVAVLCGLALAGVRHYTLGQPGQTLQGAALAALTLRVNVYEAATGYVPVLVGAWALGWFITRFVSGPLERVLLRAGASSASVPAGARTAGASA